MATERYKSLSIDSRVKPVEEFALIIVATTPRNFLSSVGVKKSTLLFEAFEAFESIEVGYKIVST
jgi:hypothetical protein